jgi:hypothetical protein
MVLADHPPGLMASRILRRATFFFDHRDLDWHSSQLPFGKLTHQTDTYTRADSELKVRRYPLQSRQHTPLSDSLLSQNGAAAQPLFQHKPRGIL